MSRISKAIGAMTKCERLGIKKMRRDKTDTSFRACLFSVLFCVCDLLVHAGTAVSRCLCQAGFDGPRCQQTRHSFSGGDSWALYPALSLCGQSHTSLELMTQSDNAVVMYHGPITDKVLPGEATDFILLEMRNGYPMLRVDHGSGLNNELLLLLLSIDVKTLK